MDGDAQVLVPSMAATTPNHAPPKLTCIKTLTESSSELKFIPSNYIFNKIIPTQATNPEQHQEEEEDIIPVIDFSLLNSTDPDQRSKVVQDLAKACQEWGFFMVVNHGIPESLTKAVMDGLNEFFNLTEEEKREFEGKHVLDPIRTGTSFNPGAEDVYFWRDFLKVCVHPEFHFPNKPLGFSEISHEYCKRAREVARELLEGISESLGLGKYYIEKALDFKAGKQTFIGNLYPPCPQPQLAMGMPPHSDHGLLTLLIENGVGGLQLQHNGNWVNAKALPNSFLVNTGDHLEILSNGKYKSVVHRAVVNKEATRMSIAIANGPSLDTIVCPAQELLDREKCLPAYAPMRFKEYLSLKQSNKLDGKSILDRIRLPKA